jgi:AcrR family transcriptional regulator
MPNSPTRRTNKRSLPDPPASVAEEREPRGARRRRETRSRLLEAALKLMAEKGMEGVAINEITEAADVGFGSFYNHFESKEAIYAALVEWVFEGFADALDRQLNTLTDPAEVVSVAVRHTLLHAQREPLWGQFLIREGFSARALQGGLGMRLLRDVQKGIAAKRFAVADPLMSFMSVSGTILFGIAAEIQFAGTLKELGYKLDNIPERAAEILLQTLGLSRAEAERIARRPLPTANLTTAADGPAAPQPAKLRAAAAGTNRSKRNRRTELT